MYNFCFHGVWRCFRSILARFSGILIASLYSSIERNTEKLNLARIALNRLQTPWKQKLYTQQEKVSRFYYIFPLFWTIPYNRCISHTNSYNNAIKQCHVDGDQRAWATCDETGSPLLGQCVMRRRTGTSAPSALPVKLMAAKNLLSTKRKWNFLSLFLSYQWRLFDIFGPKLNTILSFGTSLKGGET